MSADPMDVFNLDENDFQTRVQENFPNRGNRPNYTNNFDIENRRINKNIIPRPLTPLITNSSSSPRDRHGGRKGGRKGGHKGGHKEGRKSKHIGGLRKLKKSRSKKSKKSNQSRKRI